MTQQYCTYSGETFIQFTFMPHHARRSCNTQRSCDSQQEIAHRTNQRHIHSCFAVYKHNFHRIRRRKILNHKITRTKYQSPMWRQLCRVALRNSIRTIPRQGIIHREPYFPSRRSRPHNIDHVMNFTIIRIPYCLEKVVQKPLIVAQFFFHLT
jgi:hypothetical protein